MRPALRAYCRACRVERRFRFVAFATEFGSENTIRPRAETRACATCGRVVLRLADVTDAEAFCDAVLNRWMVAHESIDDLLDRGDLRGALYLQLWLLYLRWEPSLLTFTSYAYHWLPQRLKRVVADLVGAPFGKRVEPKAHSAYLSESLDRFFDPAYGQGAATGDAPSDAEYGRDRLERAVADRAMDGEGDRLARIPWL